MRWGDGEVMREGKFVKIRAIRGYAWTKKASLGERQINETVHPHLPDTRLPELAPSAICGVAEASQGRSLCLSG